MLHTSREESLNFIATFKKVINAYEFKYTTLLLKKVPLTYKNRSYFAFKSHTNCGLLQTDKSEIH